jgi:hypothetical protein
VRRRRRTSGYRPRVGLSRFHYVRQVRGLVLEAGPEHRSALRTCKGLTEHKEVQIATAPLEESQQGGIARPRVEGDRPLGLDRDATPAFNSHRATIRPGVHKGTADFQSLGAVLVSGRYTIRELILGSSSRAPCGRVMLLRLE